MSDTSQENALVAQATSIIIESKNLKAIDEQVGEPREGESLEDYLERAKSIVFEMLEQSFARQLDK